MSVSAGPDIGVDHGIDTPSTGGGGAGGAGAGASGSAGDSAGPGLVICAIPGRVSAFPSPQLLTAAAGLVPNPVVWDGREGPVSRLVASPGSIAIERPDLAKRERTLLRAAGRAEKGAPGHLAQLARELDDQGVPAVSSRSTITGWSRKSRARMTKTLCDLDWTPMLAGGRVPAMVTLTYPGDWETVAPDGATSKGHLLEFVKRYKRAWGEPLRWAWKLEFQRRGAPHYHGLMVPPHGHAKRSRTYQGAGAGMPFRQWVSAVWADIVAHPDPVERMKHERAGTGVDFAEGLRMSDPKRIAVYFTKHGTFHGKAYQNEVPREWCQASRGPGRFWGYSGMKPARVIVQVPEPDAVQYARTLRRWARAQGTTRQVVRAGRKLRRRVKRLPNGVGWVSVNDGAAFLSQLARLGGET